ncbi:DUF6262 family protein [Bacillus kwashiorkori]|uniref:DUF6262 family protein n=1 Tax=Bacillus kwashiorkori TaxID=1522318 RepID=UPI00078451C4|nr:DUF6262 family protein [Bacillus kwashiorkori]
MPNYNPPQTGLNRYREQKRAETEHKIKTAFESLKKGKKEVNINAVAKKAGVSTVTVYKYTELAEQIKKYRDKPASPRVKKRQNTTLAQLEVINQGLVRKIEELTKENEWLKKRIEIQNGEIQEMKYKLKG